MTPKYTIFPESYKGYQGDIKSDVDEDGVLYFYGHVMGIKDIVSYEANTVDLLFNEFKDSVDDYIEFCGEMGKDPETPTAS